MGSQQDEGLLLQPVLVPSDASEEKEQDEGPGGCGKKDAMLIAVWHVLHDNTNYIDFTTDRKTSRTKG